MVAFTPKLLDTWSVVTADSHEYLKSLPDSSVDSVVCDPPAAINFMGREWDSDRGGRREWVKWLSEIMVECLRIIKPGGHILVWALPRTSHWTALAIEDAGWEVRDVITHHTGQGMGKGANISKEIDRLAGAKRPVVGDNPNHRPVSGVNYEGVYAGGNTGSAKITGPATDEAKKWDGWGTLIKPSSEHWIMARRPIGEKTIAENVLKWGTGAVNIDACRVRTGEKLTRKLGKTTESASGWQSAKRSEVAGKDGGRWPSNVLLSHAPGCVMSGLRSVKNTSGSLNGDEPSEPTQGVYGDMKRKDWTPHGDEDGNELVEAWECAPGCPIWAINEQSGTSKSRKGKPRKSARPGEGYGMTHTGAEYNDQGGAARFYPTFGFRYSSKPKKEKHFGCENLYWEKVKEEPGYLAVDQEEWEDLPPKKRAQGNIHSTVKGTDLMQWLCRLITPVDGVVMDPFCGSGSTGVACLGEFRFLGIEKTAAYARIATARISSWEQKDREDLGLFADPRKQKKPPEATQLDLLGAEGD